MVKADLEFARSELDEEQLRWLADLPLRTEFADGEYKLVHSHPSPDKLGTYVRPDQFSKLRPYFDGHAGIVLGHTHVQHGANVDDRLVVNPGSVGQPRDGDPNAAYAILDTDTSTVETRRAPYDIDRVITRVESTGLPKRIGARLLDDS